MITTAIQIVTPATQAITTADGKQQLRVDYAAAADNTEIDNMIQAATSQVEAFTGRVCMPTVIDFYLTGFPRGGIVLPFSPITVITSIKYYSDAVTQVTWDAANYYYSLYEEPCRINYLNGTAPSVYQYRNDAVTVRCTCGYADVASVPKTIRQAILMQIGEMYQFRNDGNENVAMGIKFRTSQAMLYPYRIIHDIHENE